MFPSTARVVPAGSLAVSACLVALGLLACAGPGVTPTPIATAGPVTTAVPATTAGPVTTGPPAAIASVEGGDPVAAQLGTYTWAETGSDSPWLPGAPITVGAGEILSIEFDPPVAVESWAARYVPSGQDGPDGAVALGQGPPPASFDVPPPGTWTVGLAVVFADGQGSASYAWSVAVE
jgi:hypothetical protein